MAKTVSNIQDLQNYFNGVMQRADHHAGSVNQIVLALVGGVVWKSNGNFEVKEYAGRTANILWMYVGDKRYCFKFNHMEDCIEVCEGSHNGTVIKSFDNDTPLAELKAFFEGL